MPALAREGYRPTGQERRQVRTEQMGILVQQQSPPLNRITLNDYHYTARRLVSTEVLTVRWYHCPIRDRIMYIFLRLLVCG